MWENDKGIIHFLELLFQATCIFRYRSLCAVFPFEICLQTLPSIKAGITEANTAMLGKLGYAVGPQTPLNERRYLANF